MELRSGDGPTTQIGLRQCQRPKMPWHFRRLWYRSQPIRIPPRVPAVRIRLWRQRQRHCCAAMSAMPGRRRGHPVLATGYQSKSIQAHGTLTMQRAFRLTMIAMFICISGGAFAQIFECIDAGGKLEFAQKCAPGTVKQREVAKKGAGNLDSAAPPQTSYQQE